MGLHGTFVCIEGLDGSGQTTQVNLLKKYLEEQGHRAHATKEPTDNVVGGLIRGFLTMTWEMPSEGKQLLFAADRSHHLEREIIPFLQKGFTVITDRYMFSSMAYGGIDLPMEWIEEMNSRFLQPDITIFLDVSPEECVRRMDLDRNGKEFFEKRDTLEKVYKNYQELSNKYDHFAVIDGEKSIEKVHEQIIDAVELMLNND